MPSACSFTAASAICARVGVAGFSHTTRSAFAGSHSPVRNRSYKAPTHAHESPSPAFINSTFLMRRASSATIAPSDAGFTASMPMYRSGRPSVPAHHDNIARTDSWKFFKSDA